MKRKKIQHDHDGTQRSSCAEAQERIAKARDAAQEKRAAAKRAAKRAKR